jgi:tripeptide aminopeptidase
VGETFQSKPVLALRLDAPNARRVRTKTPFIEGQIRPSTLDFDSMTLSMSPAARRPVTRPSSVETPAAIKQEISRLGAIPEVRSAIEWFRQQEGEFARWQLELAAIPAPPFGEAARGDWLAEKFQSLGLSQVHKDDLGNVFGMRPSRQDSFTSVSAHIDTVFPSGTPLNVRQHGKRLYGPGISDNGAGVTALLAIASAFQNFALPHADSIVFIGNVGEEGEGDLRGMRHIFSDPKWKESIQASVVVDGAGTDTIVAEALGSRRFEVTFSGPGGHSWSDFGAPNPITALAHAIHLFSQVRISSSPKTTFNIGVIGGGTSVNSIPESARMRVDIRSTSPAEIDRLELQLRNSIDRAMSDRAMTDRANTDRANYDGANNDGPNGDPTIEGAGTRPSEAPRSSRRRARLEAKIVSIGDRPGGELATNARILQIARAVDAHLGNSAQVQRASTDANIPISMGREAIAIGAGGSGGGAHTLQEWFDTTGRELGLERILLIVLALSGAGS